MTTNRLDNMKKIGTELIVTVACHCPDYPIYIPFDISGEEWALGWADEELLPNMEKGLFMRCKDTGTIQIFGDVPNFLYEMQEADLDWDQLSERVGIAARSVAALAGKRVETLGEVLGETFVTDSVQRQKELETAMFKDNEEITSEIMHKYLTKMTGAPEVPKGFQLSVVEDDDEDS